MMEISLKDLGKTVYCIDVINLCILKETVYAVGNGFFVPESYYLYRCEWQIIDFEITYKTLKEAKSALRKVYLDRRALHKVPVMRLVQTLEDEWAYEEKEED